MATARTLALLKESIKGLVHRFTHISYNLLFSSLLLSNSGGLGSRCLIHLPLVSLAWSFTRSVLIVV
jgi:hypothetical protein